MSLYKNRIVVKVGTSTLTNENGKPDLRTFDRLARVLTDVKDRGYEVILVSSGAIAVGACTMNLAERPTSTRGKQAAAAVGQCSIMKLYSKFFGEYGATVAQILLTSEDVGNERRRENLINTFDTLLENGIVPIVNANDSVCSEEIVTEEKYFGDNDTLSAVVAKLVGASKLIILSDVNGLYDSDPHKTPDAKIVPVVEKIDETVFSRAGGAGSKRGTGGMITKLKAAARATEAGADVVITYGKTPENVYDAVDGKPVGTLFKSRI